MRYISKSEAESHSYNEGSVVINEFNFNGDTSINDAEITILGCYPLEGYAVNDISTALISVEAGNGIITIKDVIPQTLEIGDRVVIRPGEPYNFKAIGNLAIRYIAFPAWKSEQARNITD